MHLRLRVVSAASALLLSAVLTACSNDSASDSAQEPSSSSAVTVSHIHGLGIDPADGRLYVATHEGVISVAKDGAAARVSDKADYMGFTVAKAKTFLGSGHPPEGSDEPANRGLLRSTDSGKSWKTLSLGGEVDFHSLEFAHDTIYGYDSTNGVLRVSENGTDWDTRAELGALDLAVSPEKPQVVLATTQSGIAGSADGGRTFDKGAEPALAFLSWPEPKALYGISPTGELQRSTDAGSSWKRVGTVPGGQPQALTAVDADRVLAATQSGVYESRDGGKTFTERLPVAGGGGH
ncbi:exo-alpha-sialidase [Streptomyces armeniacus]|uniref:Exo-alpha-sialidase n=2 Tax=Streptomyces armeniacus TaxID=83291 RepID=A0A345Y0P4_9ACTN|nr:exo-alpha-sialidase [Streptomyces armeniacus]AXK37460.1 exo-alpha-sialidase [Streptomyces armeniacus]